MIQLCVSPVVVQRGTLNVKCNENPLMDNIYHH